MMDLQVDLNMYLSNYLTIGNLSTMGFWKSAHFSYSITGFVPVEG